ncbi:hypothetical protein [Thalassomonas sp. M1454]|uniref:hypothetical protein n=1 Tax=Thalassomonas sp. M1454 TaxID=2594477 RepID=UPI00117EF47B|nr:hypothetical protein [Thalassomonas sp. M1454]TRX55856.1 hypothetical protein FNN08_09570 [Thalassomonas sp. M1454]
MISNKWIIFILLFLSVSLLGCVANKSTKEVPSEAVYEIISPTEINSYSLPYKSKIKLFTNEWSQVLTVKSVNNKNIIDESDHEFLISEIKKIKVLSWGEFSNQVPKKVYTFHQYDITNKDFFNINALPINSNVILHLTDTKHDIIIKDINEYFIISENNHDYSIAEVNRITVLSLGSMEKVEKEIPENENSRSFIGVIGHILANIGKFVLCGLAILSGGGTC